MRADRLYAILIAVGVVVRLGAALFLANSQDLSTFGFIVTQGAAGHGLYDDPVFSYPPLVGYAWLAAGKLLAALGVPIVVHAAALAPYAVPGLVSADLTTPIASLLVKLPAMLGDVALAVAVDAACRRAGATDAARRVAVLSMWLNPLVIFDSAVQASWDSLVPTATIAAGLAAIAGDGAAVGAWLAFGALAKIVPVAFLPLAGVALGRSSSPSRSMAGAAASAALVCAVVFAPIAAWGELAAARAAVAGRSATAIFGGFNAWTALNANAARTASEWMAAHGTTVAMSSTWVGIASVIAVAAAAAFARRLSVERWMLAAAATFALILLTAPYVQPGYVVWLAAPCSVVGACGRPRWTVFALVVSTCAFVFVLTVRSLAAIAMPACWFFHLCDALAFGRLAQAYAYEPGALTPLAQVDAGMLLGIAGTALFAYAVVLALIDRRGLRHA